MAGSFLLFHFPFPFLAQTLFPAACFGSQKVTLHFIGQPAERHLAVQGSLQYPGGPPRAGGGRVVFVPRERLGARTAPTSPVSLREPVWNPDRAAFLFAGGFLARASAQKSPSAVRHVPAQQLTEVGLKGQVDDGVVKGGGLGKDSSNGESHGGNRCWVPKCRPHRHHRVRAPRCEEADANRHRHLRRHGSKQKPPVSKRAHFTRFTGQRAWLP